MSRLILNTMGSDAGRSGIGTYTSQLISKSSDSLDLILVKEDEKSTFSKSQIDQATPSFMCNTLLKELFYNIFMLPFDLNLSDSDVLFNTAGNRRLSLFSKCKSVATVHDFSSLHVKNKYGIMRYFYNTIILPALMKRLDLIITISNSSKMDIVKMVPSMKDKILVIPLGVDHEQFNCEHKQEDRLFVLQKFNLVSKNYFLYVARLEHPGKNHIKLIEAFEQFRMRTKSDLKLLLAGPLKERHEEILKRISESEYSEDIIVTGFLDSADLPILYAESFAFVFPSLYEGFGLPILEAMASGTPVLSSDRASLPEVGGDCCVYFNPNESSEICDTMVSVYQDQSLRETLIEKGLEHVKGFTWEQTATLTYEAIAKLKCSQ